MHFRGKIYWKLTLNSGKKKTLGIQRKIMKNYERIK